MKTSHNDEKRQYKRAEYQRAVMYRTRDASGELLMGMLRNLSGGGACLQTREPVVTDTILSIEFNLPGMPCNFVVEATAVWCEICLDDTVGQTYTVGLAFQKISENQKNEIISFVTRRLNALRRKQHVEKPGIDEKKRPVVMVVDDDADILDAFKNLVGDEYNIVTARDGGDGYLKAKESKPDLIFLDIMMPELDGFATLMMLKEDEDTRAIPVIMLSVLRDRENIVRAVNSGAADYVTKPFESDVLREKITGLINTTPTD